MHKLSYVSINVLEQKKKKMKKDGKSFKRKTRQFEKR